MTTCSSPFVQINRQVIEFTEKMDSFAQTVEPSVVDVALEEQLQYLEFSVSVFTLRIRALMAFYQFLELHKIGTSKSDERVVQFNHHLPTLIPHIECVMQKEGIKDDMSVVIVKFFVQRIIHNKKDAIAEIFFRDVLSNPHWKDHAYLISGLINQNTVINRLLTEHILPLSHWESSIHDTWLRAILDNGTVDRDFSKYVLGRTPYNTREDLKELLIKRHVDPGRAIGPIHDLKDGAVVATKKYNITARGVAGKGNTGMGELEDRSLVSLKVCVKYEPEQILSMKRENRKMEQLKELGINHPALLEEGDDYLIKEWVEGITGSEWFRSWSPTADVTDPSFLQLVQLFEDVASTSVYLQNFKPANLLWDGTIWQVIDYGGTKAIGMTPEKVRQKLYEKFDKMWNKSKGTVPPLKELIATCPSGSVHKHKSGGKEGINTKKAKKNSAKNGEV